MESLAFSTVLVIVQAPLATMYDNFTTIQCYDISRHFHFFARMTKVTSQHKTRRAVMNISTVYEHSARHDDTFCFSLSPVPWFSSLLDCTVDQPEQLPSLRVISTPDPIRTANRAGQAPQAEMVQWKTPKRAISLQNCTENLKRQENNALEKI